MEDILPKMNFVVSNWRGLYDKLSQLFSQMSNVSMLYDKILTLYNKTVVLFNAMQSSLPITCECFKIYLELKCISLLALCAYSALSRGVWSQ